MGVTGFVRDKENWIIPCLLQLLKILRRIVPELVPGTVHRRVFAAYRRLYYIATLDVKGVWWQNEIA